VHRSLLSTWLSSISTGKPLVTRAPVSLALESMTAAMLRVLCLSSKSARHGRRFNSMNFATRCRRRRRENLRAQTEASMTASSNHFSLYDDSLLRFFVRKLATRSHSCESLNAIKLALSLHRDLSIIKTRQATYGHYGQRLLRMLPLEVFYSLSIFRRSKTILIHYNYKTQ